RYPLTVDSLKAIQKLRQYFLDDLAAINVLAAEAFNRAAYIIIPHPNREWGGLLRIYCHMGAVSAISGASFNLAKAVGVAATEITSAA
ncbi:hypothetical protein FBU30_001557, partial [Linnemannia zychae]